MPRCFPGGSRRGGRWGGGAAGHVPRGSKPLRARSSARRRRPHSHTGRGRAGEVRARWLVRLHAGGRVSASEPREGAKEAGAAAAAGAAASLRKRRRRERLPGSRLLRPAQRRLPPSAAPPQAPRAASGGRRGSFLPRLSGSLPLSLPPDGKVVAGGVGRVKDFLSPGLHPGGLSDAQAASKLRHDEGGDGASEHVRKAGGLAGFGPAPASLR